MKNRLILGLKEEVQIINEKTHSVIARIDTGATKSSIDKTLAEEISINPSQKTKIIKQAHGRSRRPIVDLTILVGDHNEEITGSFTIANRKHMKYKVLIGQNILKKGGFLIDPLKEK